MTTYEIIMLIITIIFGGISLYVKTKYNLIDQAKDRIADAEVEYKDATNAGGQKFEWVVDTLYTHLPSPLRLVFTRDTIGVLVQRAFDAMEKYAVSQADKLIKKIED